MWWASDTDVPGLVLLRAKLLHRLCWLATVCLGNCLCYSFLQDCRVNIPTIQHIRVNGLLGVTSL